MKLQSIVKQKTTWTGVAAIVSAAGGFFTGTLEAGIALQLIFGGLAAIFLRQGVANLNTPK